MLSYSRRLDFVLSFNVSSENTLHSSNNKEPLLIQSHLREIHFTSGVFCNLFSYLAKTKSKSDNRLINTIIFSFKSSSIDIIILSALLQTVLAECNKVVLLQSRGKINLNMKYI